MLLGASLIVLVATSERIVDGNEPARVASFASAGGNATYGIQRTNKSGKALWRADGCLSMEYDARTVTPAIAAVFDAAFATWSDATATCGALAVTSERKPADIDAHDGKSTLVVRRDAWCRPATTLTPALCYAHGASAVTRLVFVDDPADPDDGRILESDIELNMVDYAFAFPGAPAPTDGTVLDLASIAAHEAGHALGLAHNCGTGLESWPTDQGGVAVPSCDDPDPAIAAATMFYRIGPAETGARTLAPADEEGACELAQDLACTATATGGCASTPSSSIVWLCLLVPYGVRRVRRRQA